MFNLNLLNILYTKNTGLSRKITKKYEKIIMVPEVCFARSGTNNPGLAGVFLFPGLVIK